MRINNNVEFVEEHKNSVNDNAKNIFHTGQGRRWNLLIIGYNSKCIKNCT